MAVAGEAIGDWTPHRTNTFEKLAKIGQGTYSNVYKTRDLVTGKIVALKKVRFDKLEPENVKFMAREILVFRKLDHPNVVKLEGLVTSRMSCSLYLVFEYMEHDLTGLAAGQSVKFTEPPKFLPLDSGTFKISREGYVLLQFLPAVGTRQYDWNRKYQKKAARLIQEVTANDVAQETFSLIRTVRVYGTEEKDHGRHKWWLGKLADISLQQSAAYGFWNFSFNTLYYSTQE